MIIHASLKRVLSGLLFVFSVRKLHPCYSDNIYSKNFIPGLLIKVCYSWAAYQKFLDRLINTHFSVCLYITKTKTLKRTTVNIAVRP